MITQLYGGIEPHEFLQKEFRDEKLLMENEKALSKPPQNKPAKRLEG
jgi:hypothetical protein